MKADSQDRYQRFLKAIVEQGYVNVFHGDGQLKAWDANELSYEDGTPAPLIVMWSNEAYPKAWLGDYAEMGYQLIQIPLEELHPLLGEFEHMASASVLNGTSRASVSSCRPLSSEMT